MKLSARLIIPVLAAAGVILLRSAGAHTPAPTAEAAVEQGPQNVQVHTGMTLRQLQRYMQGVAAQLGVQCDYCHDTNDFPSDEKEHKRKARQFMRMVKDINEKYIPWEAPEGERHEVVCWNCHQGQQHPPHWEGAGR